MKLRIKDDWKNKIRNDKTLTLTVTIFSIAIREVFKKLLSTAIRLSIKGNKQYLSLFVYVKFSNYFLSS
jgi:hypothetical protein